MTQRKRSPRKAASSLLSFSPAGQSISHAIVRCSAAIEYKLSISLIRSARNSWWSII
jgi:hypothetical protein